MAHYDPQYGNLLTAKEVSEITGFTMNQLRNHRQRGTSPIHFLTDGNTSWYRKEDVLKYIETHGTKTMEYHITGSYEPAPVVGSPKDLEQREHLSAMAKITTSNAWSKWTERLTLNGGMDINEAYQFLDDEQNRLYLLANGDDLSKIFTSVVEWNGMRKSDPFRFWPSRTYAIRSLARKIYGWDISDDDIVNTPIGEVPPSKIE